MCIGDSTNDTLGGTERALIAEAAEADLPDHRVAFEANEDGIIWAVLTPSAPDLLRVTICRIDPCVVVLIEDADQRRQIRGLADMVEALAFVRRACGQALSAIEPTRVLH